MAFADELLQDARVPLQHAARLVLHPAGHAARCCRTPGTATSSRSTRFTRRASKDQAAWDAFLKAFNEWAHARGGIPLLNQSPFVTRAHVVAAYGERWKTLSDWIRTSNPGGRLLNPFFKELLW